MLRRQHHTPFIAFTLACLLSCGPVASLPQDTSSTKEDTTVSPSDTPLNDTFTVLDIPVEDLQTSLLDVKLPPQPIAGFRGAVRGAAL